jgi:MATE family multidrug resistance protein
MNLQLVSRSRSSEARALLGIAIPLALGELGWMAMGVVDTIMVGRLPDSAVAIGATSVGSAVFYAFAIFALGLMSGMDARVSQAFGASDWRGARRSLAGGLALAGLTVLPIMGLIFSAVPLLGVIGVEPAVRAQAAGFARVLVWSVPPLLLYSVFRRYLQGVHHVRPVMLALVSANLVNVFGNWLLIYGHWGLPALGVRGSALSTVLARIYLAAALFVAIQMHDPGAFRGLQVMWDEVRKLFALGLPAALTIGFEVGVFNVTTALAGTLDPVSVAAHAIALNAASLTYMVPLGIGSAAAVSVGKALGARDRRRAARAGWMSLGLSSGFEIFAAMSFVFFGGQIARLYTQDPRVISLAIALLMIGAVFQLFDGLQTVATGALRGAGNTRTPMVWNLICYWVIGLPTGCWLCFHLGWGVVGLWYGLCLALILIGLGLLEAWHRHSKIS